MPQYEADLRRFVDHFRKFGLVMLLSMLAVTIAMPIVAVIRWFAVLGGLVALTGLLIMVFPFATPETVKVPGLRNSIRVARALGVLIIALGGYLAIKLQP